VLSQLCKISATGRRVGEEEASERLDRMGQSGASILSRKTEGPVPTLIKDIGPSRAKATIRLRS
jgi:hypothetical protein